MPDMVVLYDSSVAPGQPVTSRHQYYVLEVGQLARTLFICVYGRRFDIQFMCLAAGEDLGFGPRM